MTAEPSLYKVHKILKTNVLGCLVRMYTILSSNGITLLAKARKMKISNRTLDILTWAAIAVTVACLALLAASGCVIYNEQRVSTQKTGEAVKSPKNGLKIDSSQNLKSWEH